MLPATPIVVALSMADLVVPDESASLLRTLVPSHQRMVDRRAFLRRTGVAGLVAIAGCGGGDGGEAPTERATTETTSTPTEATPATTTEPTQTTTGGKIVEVAAGPEGRLRFDPETVDISVGDTVRWTFESPGHNVTSKPGSSEKVQNPEGATPFASYEGDQHYAVVEEGGTYEHTFTIPGEYVYVCEPHADQGMVGTVIVEE